MYKHYSYTKGMLLITSLQPLRSRDKTSFQCQHHIFSKISSEIDHRLSLGSFNVSLSVPRMKSSFWENDPTVYALHDQPSIIVVEKSKHQSVIERVSAEVLS